MMALPLVYSHLLEISSEKLRDMLSFKHLIKQGCYCNGISQMWRGERESH